VGFHLVKGRLAVRSRSAEVGECQREPVAVAAAQGRRDVDAVGCLLRSLDDACEGADDE
jgi:hypothetical protein